MVIIEARTVKQSEVTMRILMEPNQANFSGNAHGGEIMRLMDNAAGVAAARHAGSIVVTARVDKMQFNSPIHIGNLVTCNAKLSFVGNSSMEVFVQVSTEDIIEKDSMKIVATAFFTMVALDEEGKPREIPSLEITNDEECKLFEEGRNRYLARKQERS